MLGCACVPRGKFRPLGRIIGITERGLRASVQIQIQISEKSSLVQVCVFIYMRFSILSIVVCLSRMSVYCLIAVVSFLFVVILTRVFLYVYPDN